MAYAPPRLWFPATGGANLNPVETLRQDQQLVELFSLSNVLPDPIGTLASSDGFSRVRATTIGSTIAITGMAHLQDLADEFILVGDDGAFYRDNANPPGSIAGGTNFTAGDTNLVRFDIFNGFLIAVSQLRNIPQTINSSVTRADLGGTPARGLDVKSFARRVCMFSPTDGTTIRRSIMAFTSAVDNQAAWNAPYSLNNLDFGKLNSKSNLLGGEYYKDHLMAFTDDAVYPIYATPNAVLPMDYQSDILGEEGGGPPIIHAVVAAADRLWWISQNSDIKMMLPSKEIRSIGFPVRPFLLGLNDNRRTVTVGGWDPKYRIVWWAVSDGSDTENKDCVGVQVDTLRFYFRTLSRNAFANRIVPGSTTGRIIRLIGGGYTGLCYNEFDGSSTGDLDNSASVINATLLTPKHHLGLPHVTKKVPYGVFEFDPIGTETLTIGVRYDDSTSDDSTATYALSGTHIKKAVVPLTRPFDRVQFEVSDANSGERYRLLRYGFPDPISLTRAS